MARPLPGIEPAAFQSRGFVDWLNRFNAELSPKRYWWGPKSQEVDELMLNVLRCQLTY